jgi:hypothetical protein
VLYSTTNIATDFYLPKNLSFMTQVAIQTQVDAIKKVTQEALQSKETALKFLVDAGIVKEKKGFEEKQPTEKKK